jgi:putative FmdB family regulatory protein
MPIYEYKCENGHIFEVIQRVGEDLSPRCLFWKKGAQKLISALSLLKGKGIWVFDREYGGEILHDGKLSNREKSFLLSKRRNKFRSKTSRY